MFVIFQMDGGFVCVCELVWLCLSVVHIVSCVCDCLDGWGVCVVMFGDLDCGVSLWGWGC